MLVLSVSRLLPVVWTQPPSAAHLPLHTSPRLPRVFFGGPAWPSPHCWGSRGSGVQTPRCTGGSGAESWGPSVAPLPLDAPELWMSVRLP